MIAVIDSVEVYYELSGAGPPLILLHGNGEGHEIFDGIAPALAERFTVVAMDSIGHGQSTRGAGEMTLQAMARSVLRLMDELGFDKAHILGFSDGGNIAMIVASKDCARVSSLVLSGANAYPSGMRMSYLFKIWVSQLLAAMGSVFSVRARRRMELLNLMVKEPRLKRSQLLKIDVPTLITAGEHDIVRREHTEWLHGSVRGSELHIFPGGHLTPIKRPGIYLETITDFYERNVF